MMEYAKEGRTLSEYAAEKGPMVTKEPEIPHRLNRLFNDVQELRETVLYLGSKLEPRDSAVPWFEARTCYVYE